MTYDAFICHASEDKTSIARPLALALRDYHLDIWYDEFSLKIGDSLRRSIDKGLAQSNYGIVLLSESFFNKNWSQWELDGLLSRQLAESSTVILPVWHNVTRDDVMRYSPSLCDKLAANTKDGISVVISDLLRVIRPEGSTLVFARNKLNEYEFASPSLTDDWWLDVAAESESNDAEGTFQEAMGWGRWGFPLPNFDIKPVIRGHRLAMAALQMSWKAEAHVRRITQITPPGEVIAFIDEMPGLRQACEDNLPYLLAYAPQLAIRGQGGPFEAHIDLMYEHDLAHPSPWRNVQNPVSESLAWRHPTFGNHEASHLACRFVQGDAVASGPPVKFFETMEYIAWLLSDSSAWMPAEIKEFLTTGMCEWATWPWHLGDRRLTEDFGFEPATFTGRLADNLYEGNLVLSKEAVSDLTHRLQFSSALLGLYNNGQELSKRFLSKPFVKAFRDRHPLLHDSE